APPPEGRSSGLLLGLAQDVLPHARGRVERVDEAVDAVFFWLLAELLDEQLVELGADHCPSSFSAASGSASGAVVLVCERAAAYASARASALWRLNSRWWMRWPRSVTSSTSHKPWRVTRASTQWLGPTCQAVCFGCRIGIRPPLPAGRARSRLLREKEPVEVVLQVVVNQAAPDVVREFEVPGHRHQPVIEHPTEGLPPLNHLLHPARGALVGLGAQARHLAHDCTPSHTGGGPSWVNRSFR